MYKSSHSKQAAAYANVGIETGVSTADPHKLILMLFDGALLAISTAIVAAENKKIAEKGQAISKAIEIIGNGLQVSLNFEAGGEISTRLDALYTYMADRLLYANLHNNLAALNEVSALLSSLRDAWVGIGSTVQNPTVAA